MKARIIVDDQKAEQGFRSATISVPGKDDQTLFFESYDGPFSSDAGSDPFILATLHLFMTEGTDVHVDGKVSARLIRNLRELQDVWVSWKPEKYSRIEITADEITSEVPEPSTAIVAFSGGVDATYSVRTHTTQGTLPGTAELKAALFVHGFDIKVEDAEDYLSARIRGEKMLVGLDLDSYGVRTNYRSLGQDWEDGFGLAVAACLALYQDRFSTGIIGSSEPYDALVLPWGSSPVTDHLYGTGQMEMLHDGAGASRTDKIGVLADWPEAMEHLRVCWQGSHGDRNCGQCEKCIRTYLNFRAAGVENPEIFDSIPGTRAIRGLNAGSPALLNELRSVADHAAKNGTGGEWLSSLRTAILINGVRVRAKQNKQLLIAVRKFRR